MLLLWVAIVGAPPVRADEHMEASGPEPAASSEPSSATTPSAGDAIPENGTSTGSPDTSATEEIPPSPTKAAPAHHGVYVQLGGLTGFDIEVGDTLSGVVPGLGNVDVKPGTGLSLRVGGRSEYWGIEALLDAIPNFRIQSGGVTRAKYGQVIAGGNLRLFLPVSQRIQPSVIAGGGYGFFVLKGADGTRVESFGGGTVRAGGGVDFYFTERVALALDSTYVWTLGDIEGSDYVTFGWGLRYHF